MEKSVFIVALLAALKDEFIANVVQKSNSININFPDGTSFNLKIN